MKALGAVFIFLVFCLIVAWLVREEERKNARKLILEYVKGVQMMQYAANDVFVSFKLLGNNIIKIGEAINKVTPFTPKHSDAYRRFINIDSEML